MSGSARGWALVKWGGSLLTDKRGHEALRAERLAALAAELAAARAAGAPPVLLGHGGGSFGHAAAARHGLNRGPLSDAAGWEGACRTQDRAAALHRHVIAALHAAGLPAWSLPPSAWLLAGGGRPRGAGAPAAGLPALDAALDAALAAGERGELLPVVHGDVVLDAEWGASIASTEAVFEVVAARLAASGRRVARAIWLGETDGLLDAAGATRPRLTAEQAEEAAASAVGAAGTDVTGGMRHRLEAAARLARAGIESRLLDGRRPGTLSAALAGAPCGGTTIEAAQPG